MSLPSAPSTEPVRQPPCRRKHARSKSDQWVYIDMGAKDGGFLRDVSEGGVCFQWFPGIMPLRDGQTLQVKFKLPGTNASIEAEGQFVRHGTSEKGGGLRLLNLPAEVQRQIREWVERQEHTEADISRDPGVLPEPSGPITVTRDSVSSLAAPPGELSAEVPLVGNTSSLFWIKRGPEAMRPSPRQPRGMPARIISERRYRRGVSVESATAKQELPAPTPLARLYPTKGQSGQGTDASGRAAVWISERARPAITSAANQFKKVCGAVLQSMAVGRQSAAKAWRKSPFGVGLAVGSLALFAIGGGLVVTGRLRVNTLNTSSGGNPRSTVEAPAANSTEAPVRPQPAVSGISLPSTPTPSPQTAATGQRSVAETVRPSPSHPADPSRAVQRVVNPPVAETNANPRQTTVQSQTLSAGSAAPQPMPVTQATAVPAQSAAPVAQPTAAPAQSTVPVTQSAAAPTQPAVPVAQPTVAPTQSAAAATQSTAAPASILRSPNSEAVPSANLDPAKLLVHIDPVYPQTARAENVHGSIDVQATIGKDGVPRALKTTRGDPRLAAAAIAAISRWRYRPAMRNGQPEESQITIIVNFTQ